MSRSAKSISSILLTLFFAFATALPAFAGDNLTITPGSITVNEGDSSSSLLTGVSASTTTDFFGKNIVISIDNVESTDSLSISRVSTASSISGDVSVVGNVVYVGDGTFARRVGEIDQNLSGGFGQSIQINLDQNATIPAPNYSSGWVGWTHVNPVTTSLASVFGENYIPNANFTFDKLGKWNGTGGGPSSLFANVTGSSIVNNSVVRYHPGRFNDSLSLYLNMSATGLPSNGGLLKGAGVLSPEFNATAGDRVSFTHRNYCSYCSSTAQVSVFVGLVDVTTQQFVSVGHAVMDQGQNWADDYSIAVPATGRYQLALTAGALWSGTSGALLQTDVKFDMFQLAPPLSANWVANIIKKVEYQSTSINPPATKTVRYQLVNGGTPSATATQTINFVSVDSPAVPVNASLVFDNTEGEVDVYSPFVGVFDGHDPDSVLVFGASNSSTGSFQVGASNFDRVVASPLGDLYFRASTGHWAFVPQETVINSQQNSASAVIPMTLNGVPFSFTVSTQMIPGTPPSITVVKAVTQIPADTEESTPVSPAQSQEVSADSSTVEAEETDVSAQTLSDKLLAVLDNPSEIFALLLDAAFAPPHIITDPAAAVANPAIGATGDDSAPIVEFDPLGSPESIAALSGALVMAVSLAGGVAAATSRGGSSRESSNESNSSDSQDAELESLEASEDVITLKRKAWGDALPLFSSALLTFLDKPSHDAAYWLSRFSPLSAKLIIDGAYLRAMVGSIALVLPLITCVIAFNSVSLNHGQHLPPPWQLLLLITVIGVFDAFAGVIGASVFIVVSVFTSQASLTVSDIRMYFAVLFLCIGPALLMTAFRALRKDTQPGFVGVWDRATDFVIAPVMAGISATTAVTVMPALAGLTLPVANHVAAFGVGVACAAMLRVLLEELAVKGFPQRLNSINPSQLQESSGLQQAIALLVSYGMWVLLSGAISGEVWQVYVGSFFFLLPVILGKISNHFPNSVLLWRIMPQGMPGLVFTLLVSAGSAIIVMAIIGANPAFAAWNMVLLPIPLLIISILSLFGKHGKTPDEVRLSQRNPIIFRVGGVVIFIVALRMMGII